MTGGAITISGANTVNVSGAYTVGNTYTLIAGSSLSGGSNLTLGNTNLGFATLTPIIDFHGLPGDRWAAPPRR